MSTSLTPGGKCLSSWIQTGIAIRASLSRLRTSTARCGGGPSQPLGGSRPRMRTPSVALLGVSETGAIPTPSFCNSRRRISSLRRRSSLTVPVPNRSRPVQVLEPCSGCPESPAATDKGQTCLNQPERPQMPEVQHCQPSPRRPARHRIDGARKPRHRRRQSGATGRGRENPGRSRRVTATEGIVHRLRSRPTASAWGSGPRRAASKAIVSCQPSRR